MDYENLMKKAIDYANKHNPIWPFAALVCTKDHEVIVKTSDCAHISSLYHAEALAVHVLMTHQVKEDHLTLVTTAEPDPLSFSAIYWANICHDLNIKTICYGMPVFEINKLWPFGFDITAKEFVKRSEGPDIELVGSVLEDECKELFCQAKIRQNDLDSDHPARGVLSENVGDFYTLCNAEKIEK